MLKTARITLYPIQQKDTGFILEIRNNLDITREFISDSPLYDFVHEKWLKSQPADVLDFIIEYQGERAGRVFLNNISYRHQKGEFGIVVIEKFRNKGIAQEAGQLLLGYVFENLPIRKITLSVFSDNTPALQLYEKLGFIREGHFREEYYKNGAWRDIFRMALFRDRWAENKEIKK